MTAIIALLLVSYFLSAYLIGGLTIPQFDPEDESEARAAMRMHTCAVAIVAVFCMPVIFMPLYAAYSLLFGG